MLWTIVKIYSNLPCKKNTQRDRHRTQKPLFQQSLIVPKNPKTDPLIRKTFFQAKNFVKYEGVPFYQKRTGSKKVAQCRKKAVLLCTIIEKTLIILTGLKNNQRSPFAQTENFSKTREKLKNIFLQKTLNNLRKTIKTIEEAD